MTISEKCNPLRCSNPDISLLSGSGRGCGRTAGSLNCRDPSFECGAQLGKTVTLGCGTLDNDVADHRALGRDRDRKGVPRSARLRRLAALGRYGLGEQAPRGLEIALDIALQKAGEDLAMAAATGPRTRFEKSRRVAAHSDEPRHHGPRNG